MPLRILIADDNYLMRQALRRTLQNAGGWEVIEAENGEEALTKAREVRPQLIILDLAMPVMDGMRAARAISMALPEVPIILHTLHWTPRINVEAMKCGVRKVVPKSDSASIIAAVEELLPLIRSANQASAEQSSEAKPPAPASDRARHLRPDSPPDENGPADQ
ncbi:MAG: response regulator transcription factor [Candidatus Sulfotelmatobacter sp.]